MTEGGSRPLFVVNSLEGGGAERVVTNLAESFGESGPVDLATLDDEPDAYGLAPTVTRHRLVSGGGLGGSIRVLADLARRRRPTALVSFLTRSNLASVVVGLRLGIPVVISERVHTASHLGTGLSSFGARLLIRTLYPRAAHVICVSEGVRQGLLQGFGVRPERASTIHNFVDRDRLLKAAVQDPGVSLPERFIVAVGRLVPNKNVVTLIDAFASLTTTDHLVVLGEGPERAALEARAAASQARGRIHFPGYLRNPHAVVARARAYVSASLAEGFPNALVEAMALGRPVVSSDCDSGPAEILAGVPDLKVRTSTEVTHGVLFPPTSAADLAIALRMLDDPDRCADLGRRAERRAADFDRSAAVAAYAQVIADAERAKRA